MKVGGDTGIIPKSRGRASNRKYSYEFKGAVITAVRKKYNDFCPTIASEKLLQVQRYATREEAMREITEYIEVFYNWQRRQKRLGKFWGNNT